MTSPRETVGVIGSGVAGLTAAHLLQRRYDVTLFEADDRLGGHAHTHELTASDGGTTHVDSGFIVHNDRTYPNLLRLFRELGVATQDSDMSMSVRCEGCGLEYAGARKLGGLFPQASNVLRGPYLKMLGEVVRFHRHAPVPSAHGLRRRDARRLPRHRRVLPVLRRPFHDPGRLLRLERRREPSPSYPARYLFTFLEHHGLLSIGDSPQWRTVVGGSCSYVELIAKQITTVRSGTPVRAMHRSSTGAEIRTDDDVAHRFDRVVVATHPDQALRLLADPTPDEAAVLGAFTYSRNEAWLHHDTSVLPRTAGPGPPGTASRPAVRAPTPRRSSATT
jgi:predicted NAD/FAD-binding protein